MIFKVYGEVKGKGRPRFARRGRFVHTYTDDQTMSYEEQIRVAFINAAEKDGREFPYYPDDVPLRIDVMAVKSVPKSWSQKKRKAALEGKAMPLSKPDVDNVLKIVADALNGVAYHDDKQCVYWVGQKKYGGSDELLVSLRTMEEVNGTEKNVQ